MLLLWLQKFNYHCRVLYWANSAAGLPPASARQGKLLTVAVVKIAGETRLQAARQLQRHSVRAAR